MFRFSASNNTCFSSKEKGDAIAKAFIVSSKLCFSRSFQFIINPLFSNGVDLIHELFNIERKTNISLLSNSVKLISNYPFINKMFTKIADRGVLF